MTQNSYIPSRVLKLNVGFIIAEGPGFNRVMSLDIPQRLRIAEDLTVEGLRSEMRLTRTSEGILAQGEIECTRLAECGRCLTDVETRFNFEIEELFAIALTQTETQFFVGEDAILDLAPLLREEIYLNTPSQILCRTDCKGLCKNCGQNLNNGPCQCEQQDTDPRWSALEELQKRLANQ